MKKFTKSLSKALALVCALAMLAPANVEAAANSAGKIDISGAKVTVADQTYTGAAQTAGVTVTLGNVTLGAKDYAVKGNVNTNAGTYTVTVTGMGNYEGTASGVYKILPKDIAGVAVTTSALTYNGSKQTPAVTVKDGSKALAANDYDVKVAAQTNAGTYKLTVTGKGNYTGSKEVSYTIQAKSTSKLTVTATTKTYNGKKQTVKITVKDGKNTVATSNYTVSGNKQTNAGKYKVTITGKGNYAGKLTKSITLINPAAQKITAKAPAVKASAVKEAAKKVKITVNGVKDNAKVTYKSNNKSITVDKNGNLTVKKGTKKGTKATITITCAATKSKNYSKTVKTITYTVK